MSDMSDEQIINVLRGECREYRIQIEGLNNMEDLRCAVIKKLKAENKVQKESIDDLSNALKFYADTKNFKEWFVRAEGRKTNEI